MGLWSDKTCVHCGELCDSYVEGYLDVQYCTSCHWCPPFQIPAPDGMSESVSLDCKDHDRYNCFGDWSVWPNRPIEYVEGKVLVEDNTLHGTRFRQYYQVKCICECHVGKPTGLAFILDFYKKTPDALEAVLPMMPVHGKTMQKLVDEYEDIDA